MGFGLQTLVKIMGFVNQTRTVFFKNISYDIVSLPNTNFINLGYTTYLILYVK